MLQNYEKNSDIGFIQLKKYCKVGSKEHLIEGDRVMS